MTSHQSGFSLFELIVVIAVTSLIGVWSASTWMHQSEDLASEAMGRWLMTVKESVDHMLKRQADVLTGLSTNGASDDFQDVWRPTLPELTRLGHLPSGFSLHAPLAYDIQIRLLKPAGLCLTVGCKVEAYVLAIPKKSRFDQAENVTQLGKILAYFQAYGASVSQLSQGRVRGPLIDLPNPPIIDIPALPVGSIVLYSFFDSSAEALFLRQGEKRNVQLAGNLNIAGQLTAAGDIAATGRVASASHLQLGAVANQGSACEAAGLLAQSSQSGLLVCQEGVWKSSSKGWGGYYIDRANFACDVQDEVNIDRRNPMTGDCSCPVGFHPLLVSFWTYPRHSYNDFYTYLCVH